MKKYLIVLWIWLCQLAGFSQSVYMHEVQEDALEQEKEDGPFSGILNLILFGGVAYVISIIYNTHKESKEKREEIKKKQKIAESVAETSIQNDLINGKIISKYQNKEAWQRGYKRAVYDRMYGRPRILNEKTIEDLISEYRHLCELGHIIQANKIMEEIGYFQNITSC